MSDSYKYIPVTHVRLVPIYTSRTRENTFHDLTSIDLSICTEFLIGYGNGRTK